MSKTSEGANTIDAPQPIESTSDGVRGFRKETEWQGRALELQKAMEDAWYKRGKWGPLTDEEKAEVERAVEQRRAEKP